MTETSAAFDWTAVEAALFDLDGVLTPTAEVHMQAWDALFNSYLRAEHPDQPPYTQADYFAHVDGKPRYDGVRDFLTSRGIELPEGTVDDDAELDTVHGLGNRKNVTFNEVLTRDGVRAYPGSVALLDHLATIGVQMAVVSSSKNAPAVLAAAGLADRFEVVIDGVVAARLGLPGKPAPDTFQHAADELGVAHARCIVLEDAVSGVQAGAAGGFAGVVGVDRGAGSALADAGATIVVRDLAELIS
ncbi:haloacid dehalogenase [Luteipulveratus mongoliensis]|uniref:Beta-phosphoglucomutase n=1 Tax=Luteipulveratus mongoliensis TaxID=571913 RepID=A0A0K1JIL8_9MICO|nr:beta-phosphoglucomutase family hydrolase [Luteipulveratus mongoliensis]AKU16564.1 haloacid dehalogenase [Luteipulveratus mongoliensis]